MSVRWRPRAKLARGRRRRAKRADLTFVYLESNLSFISSYRAGQPINTHEHMYQWTKGENTEAQSSVWCLCCAALVEVNSCEMMHLQNKPLQRNQTSDWKKNNQQPQKHWHIWPPPAVMCPLFYQPPRGKHGTNINPLNSNRQSAKNSFPPKCRGSPRGENIPDVWTITELEWAQSTQQKKKKPLYSTIWWHFSL